MSEEYKLALDEIRAHEKECGLRYKHIEAQLEDGSQRFIRLENLITGLYGVIICGGVAVFSAVLAVLIKFI
tara:strand:- start:2030 stop:2242 length:213 start_codon:yes stop_codon:yes gene_type:complete